MANSGFGFQHSAHQVNATERQKATTFITAYERTHPWIQILRPWDRDNVQGNWAIVCPPLVTRNLSTSIDVARILKRHYPR